MSKKRNWRGVSDKVAKDKAEMYNSREWKELREFINKYFDIPCTIIANWNVGIYDLKEHKWVERYDKKED